MENRNNPEEGKGGIRESDNASSEAEALQPPFPTEPWICGWLGTTGVAAIAGALLGPILYLSSSTEQVGLGFGVAIMGSALAGMLLTGLAAGALGMFVFGHVAIFSWMFFWHKHLKLKICFAGAATMLPFGFAYLFGLIGGGLGAWGAWMGLCWYFKSQEGRDYLKSLEKFESLRKPFHFSILDLLWRMTATACVLALYSFLYQMLFT